MRGKAFVDSDKASMERRREIARAKAEAFNEYVAEHGEPTAEQRRKIQAISKAASDNAYRVRFSAENVKTLGSRFVPPDAPNVLPTARADPATKHVPFSMSAMSGPDPLAEARRRQVAENARWRV